MTDTWSCTSVVVSGKATRSGRPMLFKHRDAEDQNNRVRYFETDKYCFIGLVNSNPATVEEVWTGTNSAGFSIMNTAAYNFRDDSLDVQMDQEGILMYDALATCATLSDFEKLLDERTKPMGVETNFGVIDAQGGAAYYEVNNYRWIKYDVNQIDEGYRVVTNFCEAGRREDYQGWERYLIAREVMSNEFNSDADHRFFFNRLSRNTTQKDGCSIPRDITSASIVIEGVKAGSNANDVVMWTILGNPLTHIAYPLTVKPRTRLKMRHGGLNLKKEERIRQRFMSRTNK
ncbi:MAG: hypothetical protein IJ776_03670 [Paludibacteraceae bacterium]|nr:hypothetical protein [Paludibacteraceae bacterium]